MKINSKSFYVEDWCKSKKRLNRLHQDREINSIYFDTHDLQSASDNINGYANRVKYRLRWYGNDNNHVNLEFKIRSNRFNFKKIFPLGKNLENLNLFETFNVSNNIFKKNYENVFNLIGYKKLFPILNVKYLRSYYYYENMIVTYDRNISYGLFNSKNVDRKNDFGKVIELKIPEKEIHRTSKFINEFPFKISRNSKYITGLAMLGKTSYI